MESRTIPPPQASARQTEMGETFNRVLFSALDALQTNRIPYALIGGIAASGMGRPRSTHDIDIFVRPEDAEATLEALASNGFETERTDARWLFKGWKDQMMVDIIFKSQGDIYFDSEMQSHARAINYHGRDIPAVAPEDLVIIKAAVHSEVGPHHWHDALAILSHATLDWHYLIKRARRAPRRLLSLLVYAQSNDIWIPNNVIQELYGGIFGHPTQKPVPGPTLPSLGGNGHGAQGAQERRTASEAAAAASSTTSTAKSPPETYLVGHLLERLASDTRTGTVDVQLAVGGRKILVKGDAASHDHRSAIEDVIRDLAVGYEIDNQMRVTELTKPEIEEVV